MNPYNVRVVRNPIDENAVHVSYNHPAHPAPEVVDELVRGRLRELNFALYQRNEHGLARLADKIRLVLHDLTAQGLLVWPSLEQ